MTKIALFSDSHDNFQVLTSALDQANAAGAQVLLHCGDLCAPFMLARMAQHFPGKLHVIFGNNDGDGRLLQTIAAQYPSVTLHGIYAELTIDQRQIAMIHYPEPAKRIAQSGQLDLVCYGHDHQKFHEQIGRCHLVNPGELLGMYGPPTWGLYDTATHEYSLHSIP
ncbi:MAG: metallophosphoesterase family protein [Caldilineaceae bacterium]|nr:metallophosphoesterase family protein [Caldilineaceae bacterium]